MRLKAAFVALFATLVIPFAGVHAEDVTSITSFSGFQGNLNNSGSYRLDNNISHTLGEMNLMADNFVLDLNGHTLDCGTVPLNVIGSLTIKDSSADQSGKITGRNIVVDEYTDGVVIVKNGGKLTLESGSIVARNSYGVSAKSGSKTIVKGGTINSDTVAFLNAGALTMDGGKLLSDEEQGYYGQTNSSFTLNNGTVQTDGNYYGVHLSKPGSKFIMNGGEVNALYQVSDGSDGGVGVVGFKDTEITINGGKITAFAQAVLGNGSTSGRNEGSRMKLTITDGEITSLGHIAIYIPQPAGVNNISGGTIKGKDTAVEVRAGTLNISGGTFIGGNDPYEITTYSNGNASHNVAVAVVQHNTKQPIEVNITGGTFTANLPFAEANPLHNAQQYIDQISVKIGDDEAQTKPVFKSVLSEDKENFIYSGLYTHDLEDTYVAVDHGEIDEESMNAVYPYRDIENGTPDGENGSVELSQIKSLRGAIVTVNVKPAPGYIVKSISVVDANGNQVSLINNNQFIAPNSDVKVYVEFTIANPATVDQNTDYFALLIVSMAALICAISSIVLARKMAHAKIDL